MKCILGSHQSKNFLYEPFQAPNAPGHSINRRDSRTDVTMGRLTSLESELDSSSQSSPNVFRDRGAEKDSLKESLFFAF